MPPLLSRLFLIWCLLLAVALPAAAAPAPRPSAYREGDTRVVVPVASVFRNPSTSAERVTQALLGDRVRVVKRQGDWVKVFILDQYRLAQGYPGWMRASDVASSSAEPDTVPLMVRVKSTSLRSAPRAGAGALKIAYLGTQLMPGGEAQDGWIPVYVPGTSVTGYVRAGDVVSGTLPIKSGMDVVRTALQLRGTRYLWGGLSAAGIDCSGLTYESYRLHGITLPRDADQQFLVGVAVPKDQLQAGDLVFFGKSRNYITHVGMYMEDGKFVEAAGAHGVAVNVLAHRGGYQGARRVINVPINMPPPSP